MVVAETGDSGGSNGFRGPRVVNVGALFTLDSAIGRPALPAAIDDVNSDTIILKDTKLNLMLQQDSKCSGFLASVEGHPCLCS
ncbi:glutamate receptor 3.4-like [Andrographis paniculata]|uniref:glutamate receptor 3.4-like n=1 Tax=Andrographis paniculata TaxID=175694 RepID=UPI0021E7FD93|nr:glutamate receptor 3.4-like [Andrographis paniculata]